MKAEDYGRFQAVIDGAWATITHGKETPPDATIRLYWELFKCVPIESFENAIYRHLRDKDRGRFLPKIADIEAALEVADGRPSADEAWGIALQAKSEDATIVWTPEIRAAWSAAQEIVAGGDKIGARRAFIDAYERLSANARERGEPVKWEVSFGQDPHQRQQAIESAQRMNRLAVSQAAALIEYARPPMLPSPDTPEAVDVMKRIDETRKALAMQRKEREEAERAEQEKRDANRRRPDISVLGKLPTMQ